MKDELSENLLSHQTNPGGMLLFGAELASDERLRSAVRYLHSNTHQTSFFSRQAFERESSYKFFSSKWPKDRSFTVSIPFSKTERYHFRRISVRSTYMLISSAARVNQQNVRREKVAAYLEEDSSPRQTSCDVGRKVAVFCATPLECLNSFLYHLY